VYPHSHFRVILRLDQYFLFIPCTTQQEAALQVSYMFSHFFPLSLTILLSYLLPLSLSPSLPLSLSPSLPLSLSPSLPLSLSPYFSTRKKETEKTAYTTKTSQGVTQPPSQPASRTLPLLKPPPPPPAPRSLTNSTPSRDNLCNSHDESQLILYS
jgi:hypothetical protein